METFYTMTPDELLKLDVTSLPPEDLKELAYFLWCCFEEDETVMAWRDKIILPIVFQRCPEDPAMPLDELVIEDDEHD